MTNLDKMINILAANEFYIIRIPDRSPIFIDPIDKVTSVLYINKILNGGEDLNITLKLTESDVKYLNSEIKEINKCQI